MSPHLRVLAGPSPTSLVPITSLVNTDKSHRIKSDVFDGEIVVDIKGFVDQSSGQPRESEYFEREERKGVTWSIRVQGRFLIPCTADDILFGNTFDKPLKLPWGSGAALKFMQYIDPTLEHDLTSQAKPWALSPLISTMPHFTHARISSLGNHSIDSTDRIQYVNPSSKDNSSFTPIDNPNLGQSSRSFSTGGEDGALPTFPSLHLIGDDTSHLNLTSPPSSDSDYGSESEGSGSTSSSSSSDSDSVVLTTISSSVQSGDSGAGTKRFEEEATAGKDEALYKAKRKHTSKHKHRGSGGYDLGLRDAAQRRAYFGTAERRKRVIFGPEDLITTDFCYGFLEFSPSLSLRLPGGLSFDLMKYWDGQPVRFLCCQRRHHSDDQSEADGGKGMETETPWGRSFWCVAIEMGDNMEK